MNKKTLITIVAIATLTTTVTANFMGAFSPSIVDKERQARPMESLPGDKQPGGSLASAEDFKLWIKSYKGVTPAEKDIAYGMMEENASKAESHFVMACDKGDERGCFQLAIIELGNKKAKGLDRLNLLATHGKNKNLSIRSAQFIGAYVLDFAPHNKSAIMQSLEAILPHAVAGDANSQFLSAHLFAANGMYDEADKMLSTSCNNPNAESNVVSYCRNSEEIEIIGDDGVVIDTEVKETGGCGKV